MQPGRFRLVAMLAIVALIAVGVGILVLEDGGGEADGARASGTEGLKGFIGLIKEATQAVHARTPEAHPVQVTYGVESQVYTFRFIDPVSHSEVQAIGPYDDSRVPRWFAPGVPPGGQPLPAARTPPPLDLTSLQKEPIEVLEAAKARIPGFTPVLVVLGRNGSLVSSSAVWFVGGGRANDMHCEVADAADFSQMECASGP